MLLKKRVISAVSWLVLLRYSTRLIDLFKYFLITRILSPSDVGNFVLATTVVITFEALSDTGFHFAFIQKQANMKFYAKTLWIIAIVRGFIIGGIILTTSAILSSFFSSPSLFQLLLVISLVPMIKGFQSPYVLLFQKNLEFQKEFVYRFIPVVVASVSSILLALIMRDTMGLILAIILGSIVEVITSFFVTNTTFSYPFSVKKAKALFHFGKYLTAGSIFTLLMTQADSLFVGKVFGTSSLALYELAFKLANVVFTEVTDVISRVSFPVFSKLQHNKTTLLKTFHMNIVVVTTPAIVATLVFLIAPKFILTTAFGPLYENASVLLQILSIYGLLRGIVGPTGPLFLAIGKPQILTTSNVLNFILLIILLYPFSEIFGVSGVALAMVVSNFLIQPYLLYNLSNVFKKKRT